MLPTEIKVGHVFRYSYLWHWQHLEGLEEADQGSSLPGAGVGHDA